MSGTNENVVSTRDSDVVVVVEDDRDLREVYAVYLTANGCTVVEAANGLEALQQIERVRPSSVVLDLLMPRLGGLEALTRIKTFDPSIVVVVVTGAEDADLRRQALALGARMVLQKPLAPETLLSALSNASRSNATVSTRLTTGPATQPRTQPCRGRVLVVDDEAEVRSLLQDFLLRNGYDVHCVTNGAEALRHVIDEAPDVVLLDIDMPRLGGIEALTAIRGLAKSVKVVMISGKASLATAKLALAYGAFDYIPKPFDLDHLGDVVAAAVLWEG